MIGRIDASLHREYQKQCRLMSLVILHQIVGVKMTILRRVGNDRMNRRQNARTNQRQDKQSLADLQLVVSHYWQWPIGTKLRFLSINTACKYCKHTHQSLQHLFFLSFLSLYLLMLLVVRQISNTKTPSRVLSRVVGKFIAKNHKIYKS